MQIGVRMAKAIERRRVFVVDDNAMFRAAIQCALHDAYEAHELASATEALAKSERIQPDLLVLAEGVIRVNGVDLIQEFLARIPDAEILVIVDQISSGFGEECVAAGAHRFLAKPLRTELVRDNVDALLNARNESRDDSAGRSERPLAREGSQPPVIARGEGHGAGHSADSGRG
jgi:DNA-binding NarL/FixJ family response regulator